MHLVTPKEVAEARLLPDEVAAIVNSLIIDEHDGYSAKIAAWQIKNALVIQGIPEPGHMLEIIKENYARAGWEVKIDYPGFNETYHTTLIFKEA